MEKKIKFEDENIWLCENGQNTEIIGVYSFRDENSPFWPTKTKLYWASLFEHESQKDDFTFWAKSVQQLRAKIVNYLRNKQAGIKDLPQISEQLVRMNNTAWEIAYSRYGYYTAKASNEMARAFRINLVSELKKRGFWMLGKELIEREIYDLM